MFTMTKCHCRQVNKTYHEWQRFSITSEFFSKLETILSTGFTTQPRLDRLIKQMFKLTKICVELIGTIVSYYEDCFVHTSIVYNPLILMCYFIHEPCLKLTSWVIHYINYLRDICLGQVTIAHYRVWFYANNVMYLTLDRWYF